MPVENNNDNKNAIIIILILSLTIIIQSAYYYRKIINIKNAKSFAKVSKALYKKNKI